MDDLRPGADRFEDNSPRRQERYLVNGEDIGLPGVEVEIKYSGDEEEISVSGLDDMPTWLSNCVEAAIESNADLLIDGGLAVSVGWE